MTTNEIPNQATAPQPDNSPGSMRRVMTLCDFRLLLVCGSTRRCSGSLVLVTTAWNATRPGLRAFTNSCTAATLPHDKEPHS